MNKLAFFIATAAVTAVFATGCECSEAACAFGVDQGVDVHVTGAMQTYGASLPITLHLCANDECADFQIADKDGKPACDGGEDTGVCILGESDVELILSASMPGDDALVSLTIKDASGTVLFGETTTVPVAAYEPNGSSCGPSCRTSEATFKPGPASQ